MLHGVWCIAKFGHVVRCVYCRMLHVRHVLCGSCLSVFVCSRIGCMLCLVDCDLCVRCCVHMLCVVCVVWWLCLNVFCLWPIVCCCVVCRLVFIASIVRCLLRVLGVN